MTATELKAALKQLGWTYQQCADTCGYSLDAIKSYATGRRDVPKPLANQLRMWLGH